MMYSFVDWFLVILFIKINGWFNFTTEYTWDISYLLLYINLIYHDSIQLASKVHMESISLTHIYFLLLLLRFLFHGIHRLTN